MRRAHPEQFMMPFKAVPTNIPPADGPKWGRSYAENLFLYTSPWAHEYLAGKAADKEDENRHILENTENLSQKKKNEDKPSVKEVRVYLQKMADNINSRVKKELEETGYPLLTKEIAGEFCQQSANQSQTGLTASKHKKASKQVDQNLKNNLPYFKR